MSATGERKDDPFAITHLAWDRIANLVGCIANAVHADGTPDVLIAVLRGGGIPAVWLAHQLRVRSVRGIEIIHTADDSTNARKLRHPRVVNTTSLGDLTGRDVLIVDDVAGTGHTLAAAARLAANAGASHIRTAVCVLNSANWSGRSAPEETVSYIGMPVDGWVVFPWENR